MSEAVSFFSEGFELQADFYAPEMPAPAEGGPGVVLCHGYTGVKDLYLPDLARALNRSGYAVITFDYKGWGESQGPRQRLSPHGRVADAAAAVTFLGLRPEVDPGRIGVMGMSYGGSTAVWLAATDPRVQCVVSAVAPGHGARWMEGVRTPAEWAALKERSEADRAARVRTGESGLLARGDILHMDPESARLSGRARQATSAAAAGDLPIEYVDETLAFNPEWVVGHIAPRGVLFVTCDGDAVVPPAESEAMYRAAGEPKKLVVLEGFSHFEVYTGDAFDQCAAEAAAWFDRHLKAA